MDRKTIGRYEILGELGRGAMGSVLRAHDPAMGRDVAVKCILSSALAGDQMLEFRERFYREARAAGALSHPGIVPVFDVGEDDGIPYLVMELVQGRTLDAVLKHSQRYSIDRSCQIGQQIAEALGFAHRNGVIHRDIKPANILMTSSEVYGTERPRITDFGVAKLVGGEATTTGQLLGTPAFMPPEQFTGDPIDHRTDLFALGVILYRMTTGEQPFGGETLTAVSYKVVHTEPIPPSKLNPSIVPQLEATILKCLAKNPAARYQTGEELAAHLAQVRAEASNAGAHTTHVQPISTHDSGAGETINQVASLRPHGSMARTYVMPVRTAATIPAATIPADTTSAEVPVAVPASLPNAPAPAAQPKAVHTRPAKKIFVAGLLVFAAAAAAAAVGFFLHKRIAATPPQAVVLQPAPVTPAAPGPAAPVPVAAPAAKSAVETASKANVLKAAAHKPAAGTKVAPPTPAATVPVTAPPVAVVPAPAPARPAPAAAPAPAVVNFNPKTLDAATNTHLKLSLDGLSSPLTVTVQMDGKLYWSGTVGDKKSYQGLLVPPGKHQFRVLVKGQRGAKASNTVSGDFAARKHMTLSVKLRPEITDNSAVLDPAAQVSAALKKDLFSF